jgi:hypothetical protein
MTRTVAGRVDHAESAMFGGQLRPDGRDFDDLGRAKKKATGLLAVILGVAVATN